MKKGLRIKTIVIGLLAIVVIVGVYVLLRTRQSNESIGYEEYARIFNECFGEMPEEDFRREFITGDYINETLNNMINKLAYNSGPGDNKPSVKYDVVPRLERGRTVSSEEQIYNYFCDAIEIIYKSFGDEPKSEVKLKDITTDLSESNIIYYPDDNFFTCTEGEYKNQLKTYVIINDQNGIEHLKEIVSIDSNNTVLVKDVERLTDAFESFTVSGTGDFNQLSDKEDPYFIGLSNIAEYIGATIKIVVQNGDHSYKIAWEISTPSGATIYYESSGDDSLRKVSLDDFKKAELKASAVFEFRDIQCGSLYHFDSKNTEDTYFSLFLRTDVKFMVNGGFKLKLLDIKLFPNKILPFTIDDLLLDPVVKLKLTGQFDERAEIEIDDLYVGSVVKEGKVNPVFSKRSSSASIGGVGTLTLSCEPSLEMCAFCVPVFKLGGEIKTSCSAEYKWHANYPICANVTTSGPEVVVFASGINTCDHWRFDERTNLLEYELKWFDCAWHIERFEDGRRTCIPGGDEVCTNSGKNNEQSSVDEVLELLRGCWKCEGDTFIDDKYLWVYRDADIDYLNSLERNLSIAGEDDTDKHKLVIYEPCSEKMMVAVIKDGRFLSEKLLNLRTRTFEIKGSIEKGMVVSENSSIQEITIDVSGLFNSDSIFKSIIDSTTGNKYVFVDRQINYLEVRLPEDEVMEYFKGLWKREDIWYNSYEAIYSECPANLRNVEEWFGIKDASNENYRMLQYVPFSDDVMLSVVDDVSYARPNVVRIRCRIYGVDDPTLEYDTDGSIEGFFEYYIPSIEYDNKSIVYTYSGTVLSFVGSNLEYWVDRVNEESRPW